MAMILSSPVGYVKGHSVSGKPDVSWDLELLDEAFFYVKNLIICLTRKLFAGSI